MAGGIGHLRFCPGGIVRYHRLFLTKTNDLPSLRDRSDALAQPETPLSFELQGERFILHQSASVRQRRLDGDNSVIESLLDLESNEKTNSCQVCPPFVYWTELSISRSTVHFHLTRRNGRFWSRRAIV